MSSSRLGSKPRRDTNGAADDAENDDVRDKFAVSRALRSAGSSSSVVDGDGDGDVVAISDDDSGAAADDDDMNRRDATMKVSLCETVIRTTSLELLFDVSHRRTNTITNTNTNTNHMSLFGSVDAFHALGVGV